MVCFYDIQHFDCRLDRGFRLVGIQSVRAERPALRLPRDDRLNEGIRPTARYWEKVVTLDDNGQEMVIYRVYAQVSIDEKTLNEAIKAAIDRANGRGKLPQDFKKQVDAHWDQLVNAQQP